MQTKTAQSHILRDGKFSCGLLVAYVRELPHPAPPGVLVLTPWHTLRCSINPPSGSYRVYVQESNSTCQVKRPAACSQSNKVRLITPSPFLLFLSPLSETRKTRKWPRAWPKARNGCCCLSHNTGTHTQLSSVWKQATANKRSSSAPKTVP